MSTEAQINANRENAQHSTGPRSEAGKAASCQNNFRFGFAGTFCVLPSESQEDYYELSRALLAEHEPETPTERILVEKMAQHIWLSRRAQRIQDEVLRRRDFSIQQQASQLGLFLRYQTANDRAFSKCLADLLKLRAEKRKAEIGFERQQERSRAREQAETRQQDRHKMAMLLSDAKLHRQFLLNNALEAAQNREQHPPEARRAA